MATMTIQDEDWSRNGIVAGWSDDESTETAEEAADTEIAYVINNIHTAIGSGWDYDEITGTFSGPASLTAWQNIGTLMTSAADYAIEHIDEIRETAA